ncbi:kinase-like protein [Serendipita vermifera]|nr:kinase-like protein [Serendipita vermifera]
MVSEDLGFVSLRTCQTEESAKITPYLNRFSPSGLFASVFWGRKAGQGQTNTQFSSLMRRTTVYAAWRRLPIRPPNALMVMAHPLSNNFPQPIGSNALPSQEGGFQDVSPLVLETDVLFPEAPDLTNQVFRPSRFPVFMGIYSDIYIGECNGYKVAIKVIRGAGSVTATRRKLRREEVVWASLDHKNIAAFLGSCKEYGMYGALISPWYKNGNSSRYIQQRSLDINQRFEFWFEVIEGLAYLHSRKPALVHGDLKPENILIDDDGHARITDFGLVRILSGERKTGLTTTTPFTGTARYLTYELVNGNEPIVPTTASDIHALGCIGLEFIFRCLPYASRRRSCHVYWDISRGVPPATEMVEIDAPLELTQQIWTMMEACWNIDPQARPSAEDLKSVASSCRDSLTSLV